ncbi:MAG TPA: xanthine dehydrogenase family protein molybdopterin-binding subunit, partial [Actinomycetes bacterium]|nr:xanthine dehydrogenase family protein molybdopterin-binding subunit [Actinomycetes bacterium]
MTAPEALRIEDRRLLTGEALYATDLGRPLASVVFARSSMAHARIRVDVGAARKAPGVIAAYTAEDLALADRPAIPLPGQAFAVEGLSRPVLARDRVRFVGEPLAALVVDDATAGFDALELVAVDYEPLPVVVDPEAAARDEVLLFPDAGTNVVASADLGGDGWEGFDGCEVVITERIVNHRVVAAPMEGRGLVAEWREDGGVDIWLSTQAPHMARAGFAAFLGLAEAQVRIRPAAVGGAFGAKGAPVTDELLVPHLSRLLGRPLRWVETRPETMRMLHVGRGQTTTVTVGADRQGRLLAVDLDILQDCGAYPALGAFMPNIGWLVASGPYAIPRLRCRTRSVLTNTTPTGAYRGAGRPEPALVLDRMLDRLAAEIGLDPAEIRRRNVIPADAYPYTSATGTVHDSGNLPGALERVLATGGYDDLRREQSRLREEGGRWRLGIGLSVFIDITGRHTPPDFGAVEVTDDDRIVLRSSSAPSGQGHATVWGMLVAQQLGLPLDRMELIAGDTDLVPVGFGTFGSKSAQSAGTAIVRAAAALLDQARPHAAALLEAAEGDVVLDAGAGRFHVAGTPGVSVSWPEVARAAAGAGQPLCAEIISEGIKPSITSGAYLAAVRVDVETGGVRVERMVTCDDAGRILHPTIARGQVHGGLAQGIAQALFEELRYDDDGNPLNSTLADYLMPSAAELCGFDVSFQETPTDRNPLGVKGIGESGTIGATPAVQNAVIDAVAHLGVRHIDMPCTPMRVFRAIQQ